jgi:type VI secretion system protein ImpM
MSHPGAASERDTVGIYGKIPAQGDFVRVNASDGAAHALDQWVQESLEALQRGGVELPQEPVYFLYHGANAALPGVAGVLVPSRDSVGRQYPLIVFARVEPGFLATRFSGVPTGYDLFLHDAARMLESVERLDAPSIAARARALRVPSPHELAQVDVVCNHVLQTTAAGDVQWRLFGDPNGAKQYYAFKTAIEACDTTRTRPPRVPITLDCPVASDVDLFLWLEVARRRLYGSPVVPSFVWTEGASPRLLLTLGAATGTSLRFMAKPSDTANQLWPLVTTRADMIEQSRQTIAPHWKQALDTAQIPLEFLLSTLAR